MQLTAPIPKKNIKKNNLYLCPGCLCCDGFCHGGLNSGGLFHCGLCCGRLCCGCIYFRCLCQPNLSNVNHFLKKYQNVGTRYLTRIVHSIMIHNAGEGGDGRRQKKTHEHRNL